MWRQKLTVTRQWLTVLRQWLTDSDTSVTDSVTSVSSDCNTSADRNVIPSYCSLSVRDREISCSSCVQCVLIAFRVHTPAYSGYTPEFSIPQRVFLLLVDLFWLTTGLAARWDIFSLVRTLISWLNVGYVPLHSSSIDSYINVVCTERFIHQVHLTSFLINLLSSTTGTLTTWLILIFKWLTKLSAHIKPWSPRLKCCIICS